MIKWITDWFHRRRSVSGAVVFLDKDILSDKDIDRIKQRMTPVFVVYSGRMVKVCQKDISKSVIQS